MQPETIVPAGFNIDNSPIADAYRVLGAKNPGELYDKFLAEDQLLMKSGNWDYNDKASVVNHVREILEEAGIEALSGDEKEAVLNILWLWYHHAISCAIWVHKDREAAEKFSELALQHQSLGNTNKITQLLYFLVRGQLNNAANWVRNIADEERPTAEALMESYKQGGFSSRS